MRVLTHPPHDAMTIAPVPRVAGLLLAFAVVASGGCGGEPPAEAAQATDAGLTTVQVAPSAVPSRVWLDGVVEAVHQATITAQTAGRVEEVHVEPGDEVARGQVLLRLRGEEQRAGLGQARAALAAAEARAVQARAQHERIRDMYERRVVARATYDEALAGREAAAAGLAAARAGVAAAREGVGYTEVRATFDGIVTEKRAQPGEAVAPGTPLMSVVSREGRRVIAEVPQALVASLDAAPGSVSVQVGTRAFEAAKVTVYPAAQPQSGTFRARFELPADAATLAPGTFARVGIAGGATSERLLVPRSAVVERSEMQAVYVVDADGRVALRQVRLGRGEGERVEVLAGVAAGERIATEPSAAALATRRPSPSPRP